LVKIAEELALLDQSIELCRSSIAYHERSLASLEDKPDGPAALALVKLYKGLLERQLARRAELLSEIGD
jgi:hypothetical protein